MAIVNLFVTKPKYLSQIPVRDGNIVFVEQSNQVCLDFHNERYTYETIHTFHNEAERIVYRPFLSGYYFVIETGCLWYFDKTKWTRITKTPEDIITFVEVDMPATGKSEVLYVSKKNQNIMVWDKDKEEYSTVSNYTKTIDTNDITNLFRQEEG